MENEIVYQENGNVIRLEDIKRIYGEDLKSITIKKSIAEELGKFLNEQYFIQSNTTEIDFFEFLENYVKDNEDEKEILKIKVLNGFQSVGDLQGLEEIEKNLKIYDKQENYQDIADLLNVVLKLNYIEIETETMKYASKYHNKINDIYFKTKMDLLDLCGIEWFDI